MSHESEPILAIPNGTAKGRTYATSPADELPVVLDSLVNLYHHAGQLASGS